MRAGDLPAFHIVWSSPRGLVIYPPGPRTTSRSPDLKPISPSVTIEYSSSRVCRCGGTSAPTEKGCSTIDTAPPVSAPHSLNTTPIDPRLPARPAPGWTTVRGGAPMLFIAAPLLRDIFPGSIVFNEIVPVRPLGFKL